MSINIGTFNTLTLSADGKIFTMSTDGWTDVYADNNTSFTFKQFSTNMYALSYSSYNGKYFGNIFNATTTFLAIYKF